MRFNWFATLTLATLALVSISPAWAQPPGGRRGGGGGPQGGPGGRPGNPLMHLFDTDRDGTLSSTEIEAASTVLKGLDQNGDSTITPDEMPGGPGGPQGGPGGGPPRGRRGRGGGPGGPPDGFGGGPGGPGGFGQGDAPFPPGGPQGDGPPPRMELGQVLPPFVRDHLGLDEAQNQKLTELEQEVKGRLSSILTDDQRSQIEEMLSHGPPHPDGPPPGGPGSRGGRRGGRRPPGPRPEDE